MAAGANVAPPGEHTRNTTTLPPGGKHLKQSTISGPIIFFNKYEHDQFRVSPDSSTSSSALMRYQSHEVEHDYQTHRPITWYLTDKYMCIGNTYYHLLKLRV